MRPLEGVRDVRNRRMLSQQELADRAGVSLFTVQRIERGDGSVRPKTGRAIAEALGVRVEDLVGKAQAPLPDIPPGQAYFVPLEEGEEQDTVTLGIHYVWLFNGDEPILQAVRKASADEEAAMRRQLEMTGRSRE